MAGTAYQEWLGRNAHRSFPFVENTVLVCEGGDPADTMPNSIVLDARFCLFLGETGHAYLEEAEALASGDVRLRVLLEAGDDRIHVDVTSAGSVAAYSDQNSRFSFRIVVGTPSEARTYRLANPAKFLDSRVLSVPFGIGVDTVGDADGGTARGIVEAADGHNTELDISENNLVLSIGNGIGLGVLCPGSSTEATCRNVLYFINGQRANSDGSFSIMAGEGVAVTTGTYSTRFGDIPAVVVKTNDAVGAFMGN